MNYSQQYTNFVCLQLSTISYKHKYVNLYLRNSYYSRNSYYLHVGPAPISWPVLKTIKTEELYMIGLHQLDFPHSSVVTHKFALD